MSRFVNAAVRGLWGLALTAAVAAPAVARADAKVYQQALPATALVVQPLSATKASIGTGTLIDADRRLLVTANHVVADKDDVHVYFAQTDRNGDVITDPAFYVKANGKNDIPGRVVARRLSADLALIELDRVPGKVRPVGLAAEHPHAGDALHVIGNSGFADGALWRYTPGEVRNVYNKKWGMNDGGRYAAWVIEMAAPINEGDSGGPVLNDKGELIGVVSNFNGAKLARELDYSIEVREVAALLDDYAAAPAPDGPKAAADAKDYSLVGPWARTTPNDDGNLPFLMFFPDGSVKMGYATPAGKLKYTGEYTYRLDGGVLAITADDGTVKTPLAWLGPDSFRLSPKKGDPTVWQRVKKDADAAPPQAPAAPKAKNTLVGRWITADTDADGNRYELKLAKDGAFRLTKRDSDGNAVGERSGTYEAGDGSLTLYVDGDPVLKGKVEWDGAGRFTLTSKGEAMAWVRK